MKGCASRKAAPEVHTTEVWGVFHCHFFTAGRGMGMSPEEILTRQAMSEPHRTYATIQDREEDQIRALCFAFKDSLKRELLLKQGV